jgi:hypothetical protein
VNDPSVLARVRALLPPNSVPSPAPVVEDLFSLIVGSSGQASGIRRYNLLYAGAALLARTMDLEEVFHSLEHSLHLLIAHRARRRVFVRGNVVAWGDHAIVLLGERSPQVSDSIAALVHAGGVFYSDTYAVFDTRGRVHPYRRVTFRIDGTNEPTGEWPVELSSDRRKHRSLPVRLILVPQPESGPDARILSSGQALIALLGQAIVGRTRTTSMLTIFERAVGSATALALPTTTRPIELLLECIAGSGDRQTGTEKGAGANERQSVAR